MGFVHNDLKPENILTGYRDPQNIYLIDYGLATKYKDKKEFLSKFSGNFIFASPNSCRGNSKSRRDDIQSLIFLYGFLMNNCKLPWSNFDEVLPGK